MIKRKIVYVGYLKGTVLASEQQNRHLSIEEQSRFSSLIGVLQDNEEFSKVLYGHNGFKNGIEEEEKLMNVKFPISAHQFNNLSDVFKERLNWPPYGIDTDYVMYVKEEYKNLIERNVNFIVPILVLNQNLPKVDLSKINLPADLLEYINNGFAKIVILQNAEGFFYDFETVEWIQNFAKKFNLNKDNLTVECGNQNFKRLTEQWSKIKKAEPLYSILTSTEFEDRPWFVRYSKVIPSDRLKHYEEFYTYLEHKRLLNHNKRFLCLARRFSPERAMIFHKIHNTPALRETSLYSLHNPYQDTAQNCTDQVRRINDQVADWFDNNFDFVNGHSCDRNDQHVNWAGILSPQLHYDTFMSVVVETHQHNPNEIFLSEKTYRPIYTAQPFIIFGNPGTLRTLKEMGYKTFSKFWDESYDYDLPLIERINKVYELLDTLSKKSWEEINSWMWEIEPILEHNFNVLMSNERINNKNETVYRFTNKLLQPDIHTSKLI